MFGPIPLGKKLDSSERMLIVQDLDAIILNHVAKKYKEYIDVFKNFRFYKYFCKLKSHIPNGIFW